MNNTKETLSLTVEEVNNEPGNVRVKAGGTWYNVSKFSAFKDFEVGKTYDVEVENYEYQGFLKNRIMRVMPK